MKKVISGCFLWAYAALTLAGEWRIGFVDTSRILRESAPAKAAEEKIIKEFAAREQEVKSLAKKLQDMRSSLESSTNQLTEAERRNKEREIANLNVMLQTRQREFREDLTLRQNEEIARILAKADRVIKQIAESEHYAIILQEAVYRSPEVDITDKVLQLLSAEQAAPASSK